MRDVRGLMGCAASVCLAAALVSGCASPGPSEVPPPPEASQPGLSMVERSALRERAIGELERAARGDDALLRANAIEGLLLAPARLRPVLALALTDENEAVRSVAAMALGEAAATTPGLCDLSASALALRDDRSAFVRASAIYAGVRCNAGVDRSPLAQLLMLGATPGERSHAAFVLGEIGDRSAVPLLRSALASGLPNATQTELLLWELQISEAMAKLGDRDQVQVVRASLYPSRPEELEVTALAAQILGEIGDRASTDQLIVLTAYRQDGRLYPAEIRLAAGASLAKLGNPNGVFLADQYRDAELDAVRSQAAHLYGVTGDPTRLRVLERMLDDRAGIVRVAAAAAIVRMTTGG